MASAGPEMLHLPLFNYVHMSNLLLYSNPSINLIMV